MLLGRTSLISFNFVGVFETFGDPILLTVANAEPFVGVANVIDLDLLLGTVV